MGNLLDLLHEKCQGTFRHFRKAQWMWWGHPSSANNLISIKHNPKIKLWVGFGTAHESVQNSKDQAVLSFFLAQKVPNNLPELCWVLKTNDFHSASKTHKLWKRISLLEDDFNGNMPLDLFRC